MFDLNTHTATLEYGMPGRDMTITLCEGDLKIIVVTKRAPCQERISKALMVMLPQSNFGLVWIQTFGITR